MPDSELTKAYIVYNESMKKAQDIYNGMTEQHVKVRDKALKKINEMFNRATETARRKHKETAALAWVDYCEAVKTDSFDCPPGEPRRSMR